jgi:hypothetical protein
MTRLAATLLLVLATVPAAWADASVNDTANAWRARLQKELPAGTPRSSVVAWAKQNNLGLVEGDKPSHMILGLGDIKDPAPASSVSPNVCTGWGISADLAFSSSGELLSREVRTLGHCL